MRSVRKRGRHAGASQMQRDLSATELLVLGTFSEFCRPVQLCNVLAERAVRQVTAANECGPRILFFEGWLNAFQLAAFIPEKNSLLQRATIAEEGWKKGVRSQRHADKNCFRPRPETQTSRLLCAVQILFTYTSSALPATRRLRGTGFSISTAGPLWWHFAASFPIRSVLN